MVNKFLQVEKIDLKWDDLVDEDLWRLLEGIIW